MKMQVSKRLFNEVKYKKALTAYTIRIRSYLAELFLGSSP